MPGTRGPKPWTQYGTRTTFLRVPSVDWNAVKRGLKSEFRMSGRAVTQVWNLTCPTPVVAYTVNSRGEHQDPLLMVLERTWREPLGAISAESLEREGFPDMAHFRRYWMARQKSRFKPLLEVQVYRVRPFKPEDREPLGLALLDKLYGEHMP